ncbi:MAG: hypothetical protein ABI462_07325 [Ignavibacteria bacterium]
MIDLNRLNKYFTYDEKLKVVVSVITGALIVIFNTFSGIMIVDIISDVFLGIRQPDIWILLIYIIPGMIVGSGLLKLCITIVELIIRGIQIEEYSYIRLVLLSSIGIYLFILIFYTLLAVLMAVERKIIPGFPAIPF